ncbi:MAG: methyltransferase [Paramuribaculum sp.]|nr:methyltransferase [Paramuribaculum sp.]
MKEKVDDKSLFRFKRFSLENNVAGLKIGTDAVLLGAWAHPGNARTIWDVGTGTGVIALMLAQRSEASITGFEIDPQAAAVAASNFKQSPWGDRMRVVVGDAVETAVRLSKADLIISNPPYYAADSAIAAKVQARDVARRSSRLSFKDVIEIAAGKLSPDGNLFLVSPESARSSIEWEAAINNLKLRRLTAVRTKAGSPPTRLLWHFSRKGGTIVSDSLSIRDLDGAYTPDYIYLTKEYYLQF